MVQIGERLSAKPPPGVLGHDVAKGAARPVDSLALLPVVGRTVQRLSVERLPSDLDLSTELFDRGVRVLGNLSKKSRASSYSGFWDKLSITTFRFLTCSPAVAATACRVARPSR